MLGQDAAGRLEVSGRVGPQICAALDIAPQKVVETHTRPGALLILTEVGQANPYQPIVKLGDRFPVSVPARKAHGQCGDRVVQWVAS